MSNNLGMLSVATAAAMPFYHRRPMFVHQSGSSVYTASESATFILKQHLQANSTALSALELYKLVKSTAHRLATSRSYHRGYSSTSRSPLAILVTQVFFALDEKSLVTYIAAVTLAAAAFGANPYPGGEFPSRYGEARLQRAVHVLPYYHSRNPAQVSIDILFAFGFLGMLPNLDFESSDVHIAEMPGRFAGVVRKIWHSRPSDRTAASPDTYFTALRVIRWKKPPDSVLPVLADRLPALALQQLAHRLGYSSVFWAAAALRPLLACRNGFAELGPSIPDRSLPNMKDLLSHLGLCTKMPIRDSVLRTMQFVVDFCHADPNLYSSPDAELREEHDPLDWHATLQEVKNVPIFCDLPSKCARRETAEYPSTAVVEDSSRSAAEDPGAAVVGTSCSLAQERLAGDYVIESSVEM
ncbi:hypothetical protein FRC06_007332 [Ceratobasidium sp. 370]|nr:hypothetical protein FRC06_007332 [Ceratobasidium sp. 370]